MPLLKDPYTIAHKRLCYVHNIQVLRVWWVSQVKLTGCDSIFFKNPRLSWLGFGGGDESDRKKLAIFNELNDIDSLFDKVVAMPEDRGGKVPGKNPL